MTAFTVPTSARPITEDMFADLGIDRVEFDTTKDNGNQLVVMVPLDLTWEQVIRAKCRLLSATPQREQMLWAAFNGWKANRAYLNLATPTQGQAVAQVRTLTQQMQGVLEFLLPDLADNTTITP